MLTLKEVHARAKAWLSEQQDIPEGCAIRPKEYLDDRAARFCIVSITVPKDAQQFCLLRFLVLDTGEIKLLRNRVEHIRKIIRSQYGLEIEDLYKEKPIDHADLLQRVKLLIESSNSRPNWFNYVEFSADPQEDSEFDFYAHLVSLNKTRVNAVVVPGKVKSTSDGRADYCRKLSSQETSRRIVVVASREKSNERIVHDFWHLLAQVRKNSYFR